MNPATPDCKILSGWERNLVFAQGNIAGVGPHFRPKNRALSSAACAPCIAVFQNYSLYTFRKALDSHAEEKAGVAVSVPTAARWRGDLAMATGARREQTAGHHTDDRRQRPKFQWTPHSWYECVNDDSKQQPYSNCQLKNCTARRQIYLTSASFGAPAFVHKKTKQGEADGQGVGRGLPVTRHR